MKRLYRIMTMAVCATLLLSISTPVLALTSNTSFSDVPPESWCATPVAWAIEQGITNGTSATTFSPDDTCSNAQVLTFLWRACGSPDATGNNPFDDITGGSYYYKAALWAYESGMVGSGSFQPDKPCTRSMAVDYMWKQAGCPISNNTLSFSDVDASADYFQAIAWALEVGITNGTSNTTFSPDSICTRAQIITFLYRNTALRTEENQDSDSILEIII